ncbi:hypothetical protein BEH94_11035 [Candidatus Altiarchaeales archaeon WOR_SM1_SCG]|nr:hypothetical protein BEH94_11035 [Candidatus Altiarchaeales archaeon WOR_SM1_SCG]
MEQKNKKIGEKFKDEMKKYLGEQFKIKEKSMPGEKKPREILSGIVQESLNVFRNMFRYIMKDFVKERADLNIIKRTEEISKKRTMGHFNESVKDRGREMSQKQLADLMKEHGRKELDKELNAIVHENLKRQMKSQINAQLRSYASSRVQSMVEMQTIEDYAAEQTEKFVIDTTENMVNKPGNYREN